MHAAAFTPGVEVTTPDVRISAHRSTFKLLKSRISAEPSFLIARLQGSYEQYQIIKIELIKCCEMQSEINYYCGVSECNRACIYSNDSMFNLIRIEIMFDIFIISLTIIASPSPSPLVSAINSTN